MNEWKKLALETARLTLRNTKEQLNQLSDLSVHDLGPIELQDTLNRIKELEVSYYALSRDLNSIEATL